MLLPKKETHKLRVLMVRLQMAFTFSRRDSNTPTVGTVCAARPFGLAFDSPTPEPVTALALGNIGGQAARPISTG